MNSSTLTISAQHEKLKFILPLLCCLTCRSDLILTEDNCVCTQCKAEYPIINGVPRFVPSQFYQRTPEQDTIQEKTKNYFGFKWDNNQQWGFYTDEEAVRLQSMTGGRLGTISARQKTFDTKCRMEEADLVEGNIVLDAGCGNGRYTYEAAVRGKAFVIGVDIGYGSVKSAYENTKALDNVIILQGNLLNLPFKDGVIDRCFSNGVLMHTGNARQAFHEVSRCVKPEGIFVAHVYHLLNPIWEFNDWWIREITTRLSIEKNMVFATWMAFLAAQFDKIPGGLKFVNHFVRFVPSEVNMYDWYSAPIATHHTFPELAGWFEECGFEVLDQYPKKIKVFHTRWGINLKGKKRVL
jgi:SAM-dependent methyltransferase